MERKEKEVFFYEYKASVECTIRNQAAGKNDGGTRSQEQGQILHSAQQFFYFSGPCHLPVLATQVKCFKTLSSSSPSFFLLKAHNLPLTLSQ